MAGTSTVRQAETPPLALPVLADNIPAQLRERRQWVGWHYEWAPGRWAKVPKNPCTGRNAAPGRPGTWGTFGEALAYYQQREVAGIGFMFAADDPFAGVDLDDARKTGKLEPWAEEIVAQLRSYGEVSPSGTGAKLFVRGALSGGRNRRDGIELYDRGRFFAVTGHRLARAPVTVEDCQEPLNALYVRLFGEAADTPKVAQVCVSVDGQALLDMAMRAQNGGKFWRLWNGDWSGYKSHSEADLALCRLLAFWTGGDEGQMDCLFRSCGLFRPKWDERRGETTYGERTIRRALKDQKAFFTPGYGRTRAQGHLSTSSQGVSHHHLCLNVLHKPSLATLCAEAEKQVDVVPGANRREKKARVKRVLVVLCELLQHQAGNQPFFLDARKAAKLLKVHFTTAWRWLRELVKEDVLRLANAGSYTSRRANEYWLAGATATVPG